MTTHFAQAFILSLLIGSTPAAAATTWICSVIQDGKPQVMKYTVEKNLVAVSDPLSRLIDKFVTTPGEPLISLKLVEDSAKGLVAVGDGISTAPGELSNYSTRMLIINKHTGAMSYLLLSTLSEPSETKGNCTK
jgi:hypothetical protein